MQSRSLYFCLFLIGGLSLQACSGGSNHGRRYQPVRKTIGVNYCPDRLPAAQSHITQLLEEARQKPSVRRHTTVVRDRWGKRVTVTVVTEHQRPIDRRQIQTGLSDLVLNCGTNFSDNDCFVDVFLDGQKLADIGPTQQGLVPFRCLLAGRRHLRITSPGNRIVFDGYIRLRSDHEQMIEINKRSGYRQVSSTYLSDRVPGVHAHPHTRPRRVVRKKRVVHHHPPRTTTRPRHAHPRTTQPRTTRSPRQRHVHHVSAMNQQNFMRLKQSIRRSNASRDKLSVLRSSIRRAHFTSEQARQVVSLYAFSSARVDAAVMLYPKLVDKQNFRTVYRAFKFSSERAQTKKRLNLR